MSLALRHGSTRTGWIAAIVVVIATIGIVFLAIPRGRDVQDAPPHLAGEVWGAESAGQRVIAYLTREERSTSTASSEETPSHIDPYSRIVLAVRRVPDGSLLHSLPLGDFATNDDAHVPRIIGIAGDVVWLWRGELEARRLSDLTVVASARTIAGRGAESESDPLPTEMSAYRIASNPVTLIARGKDARFYAIDAATSAVTPFDPSTLPPTGSTRAEDWFNDVVPPGRPRGIFQPSDVLQRSFLTSTGKWYSLLSESERAGVSRWPGGHDRPSGEVARSLYRADYKLDDRKQPEIDPGRLTQIGTARLIQAGFLVRGPAAVWDVPDPSSSLVLAKSELGSATPWEVVRLARDGTVVWRTSTGMSKLSGLLDLGSHIAFLGTVADRRHLVWIDQQSGARHLFEP